MENKFIVIDLSDVYNGVIALSNEDGETTIFKSRKEAEKEAYHANLIDYEILQIEGVIDE